MQMSHEQELEPDNEISSIISKNTKRSERMLRSEAARAKRREVKDVKEIKRQNEWAKARRERKNK